MKLSETITMMNSSDYKERFRAEYFQLQNRIEAFDKTLAELRQGKLKYDPKCTIKLLDGQMNAMKIYKTHLEEIAKIEKISLEEVVAGSKTVTSKTEETK